MASLLRRAACAAVVLTAFPVSAHAFCRTTTIPVPASFSPTRGCFTDGLVLFWKGACVSYSVNKNASTGITLAQAKPLIDQAFTTWTSTTCASGTKIGISASPTDDVECDEVRYNQNGPNQNVIVFRDNGWPYNDPNNTLGLTTVTFNADTGEIYDADMEINASGKNLTVGDPVPAKGFDLLSVVTHEAGHFFGLAHATDSSATMFASYKPGTITLRTLASDDIAGICAIYPTTDERVVDKTVSPTGQTPSTPCDVIPRHGFGTTCAENPPPAEQKGCSVARAAVSGGGGSLALVGVAAAGAVAVARRRRRV